LQDGYINWGGELVSGLVAEGYRGARIISKRVTADTRLATLAEEPAESAPPAWCGAIRERNLAWVGSSWQTEVSAGSGSRPIHQWCC
jgi:hypothetical protein